MEQMDALYRILQECIELYENFLELEYEKYDVVIKNDIEKLDEIVAKEQVFYMKMRGVEQKREKLIVNMNMKEKTLKEIILLSEEDKKHIMTSLYDKLTKLITDVKKINGLCKTLIEVRLHRIDKVMSEMGENNNTYTNREAKNSKYKSRLISKKI
ncbi:flagellar protein FlgN [Sedimentibacter sp. MB31-C6]|uniref:flagellar protein FlgN n=1 Tax=Sedimentibacter sp. MB31-C6 TaxID=3109366 RepID=UPI002DDCADAD|nr:flagellar protein FlgN [Sedimentibacter sp. MB36-C1]WSI05005.1 flagellar protein FlgN [Sedimentibacter sp. MB36-C1]